MLSPSDFDFNFPKDRIAEFPLPRGTSKMLVKNRNLHPQGACEHKNISDLINYLNPGDALVLNETKVIPARLIGYLNSGAKVEILLLKELNSDQNEWQAMVKSSNKCLAGTKLVFSNSIKAEFMGSQEGYRLIRFDGSKQEFSNRLEIEGLVPLPPYIKRETEEQDKGLYQSIFAKNPGSVAAPTASLHFTEQILKEIEEKSVRIVKLTLHVGAGTFAPVKSKNLEDHLMHSENFSISDNSCKSLNEVKSKNGKIVAVGTTVARVLESVVDEMGNFKPQTGETDIFIYPGYQWKGINGLLTNFHWPKSTLFMLVCSLLGIEEGKKLYSLAIQKQYRLFSYGDSMLII